MDKYKTKNKVVGLSPENILKLTTEAEIYRHYLGYDYVVGTLFNSPLPGRKDRTPSFGIYAKDGKLLWNDFGDITKEGAGDVFKFVRRMLNCGFLEALQDINNSMRLGIIHSLSNSLKSKLPTIVYKNYQQEYTKKNAFIQIVIQNYTKADLDYWKSGGVSRKTLQFFKIHSTKVLYYNCTRLWTYSEQNPIYSWVINNKIKSYRPYEKEKAFKWLNNCTGDIIQGWDQLPLEGDLVVITKSYKDVAVFKEIGIPAIAPQSENVILTEDIIENLYKRFPNIIVMFDNDKPGLEAMSNYEYIYGLPYTYIPQEKEVKDPFEYVQKYGIDEFKKFML